MKRWTWNIVAALSAMLCIAVAVLWARSYAGSDYVTRAEPATADAMSVTHHTRTIKITRGDVRISRGIHTGYVHVPVKLPPEKSAIWGHGRLGPKYFGWEAPPAHSIWNQLGFYTFAEGLETSFSSSREEGFAFPAWLPMACLAILPALWILRLRRRRGWRKSGRCPVCGYDLRATPHRCPECGSAAPQPVSNPG